MASTTKQIGLSPAHSLGPPRSNFCVCLTGHNRETSLRTRDLQASDFRSLTLRIKVCRSKSAMTAIKPHQSQHFRISIAFFSYNAQQRASACICLHARVSIAGSAAESMGWAVMRQGSHGPHSHGIYKVIIALPGTTN